MADLSSTGVYRTYYTSYSVCILYGISDGEISLSHHQASGGGVTHGGARPKRFSLTCFTVCFAPWRAVVSRVQHLVDVVGHRSASFSLLDSSSLSRGWHSR